MGKSYEQQEKGVLKDAAEIITQELEGGEEISIPKFGKFYLTKINTSTTIGGAPDTVMNKVCFRPYGQLKSRVAKKESVDDLF
ncbi:MAG: HU family DNA-binding protein [Candidatus Thorarchaeota archaeon]